MLQPSLRDGTLLVRYQPWVETLVITHIFFMNG